MPALRRVGLRVQRTGLVASLCHFLVLHGWEFLQLELLARGLHEVTLSDRLVLLVQHQRLRLWLILRLLADRWLLCDWLVLLWRRQIKRLPDSRVLWLLIRTWEWVQGQLRDSAA
jgi:hypothetical protein